MIASIRSFVANNPGLCGGAALFLLAVGLMIGAQHLYWTLTGVTDPLSTLH